MGGKTPPGGLPPPPPPPPTASAPPPPPPPPLRRPGPGAGPVVADLDALQDRTGPGPAPPHAGRAAARALRDRHARARPRRGDSRRLRSALRQLQRAGDARRLPPRLLRRGSRRRAVRAARRSGATARATGDRRGAAARARRDRSGPALRSRTPLAQEGSGAPAPPAR